MKKLTFALAAVSFVSFAAPAFAEDTTKTETKTEHHTGKKGKSSKTETTTTTDPGGLMNSTTDKSKTEKEMKALDNGGSETTTTKMDKHDAPGMKNDSKTKTKEKVVKDAAGNVVKDEVTH